MNIKKQKQQNEVDLVAVRKARADLLASLSKTKKGEYTIYKNNVYQIGKVKDIHPGGKIIELALNKDCTQLVECYHPDKAYSKIEEILQKHHVMKLEQHQQLPIYDDSFLVAVKKNVQEKMEKLKLKKHSYEVIAVLEVIITVSLYLYFTFKLLYKTETYLALLYGFFLGILTARLGFMMHMGSHRGMSKNQTINTLVEYCMDLIGGSSITWRNDHVYQHHTAPNEVEIDGDCKIGDPYIRLHPQLEWKWYHVYQAPLVVTAMSIGTIKWVLADISQFLRTLQRPNNQNIYPTTKNWIELIIFKTLVIILHIILPAYNNDFLVAISSTLIMFFVSSHYMEQIFIVNHIQGGLVPRKNIHWAIKQIEGTADWSSESHIANFLSGGLNHQVIHHLFPNTSHWIYPELVPVVKDTCKEFGLQYKKFDSFWTAWMSMFTYLDQLGANKQTFTQIAR